MYGVSAFVANPSHGLASGVHLGAVPGLTPRTVPERSVNLMAIRPSFGYEARSLSGSRLPTVLRHPQRGSLTTSRLFALPQLPPGGAGEEPKETATSDLSADVVDASQSFFTEAEVPAIVAETQPTSQETNQLSEAPKLAPMEEFGQRFFKPLMDMGDSLRAQFEFFTHPRTEGPIEYAPEYGRAMANHLPMALSALRQLGAGPETCAAFEAAYIQRTPLKTLAGQKSELHGNPNLSLGRRQHYLALRNTFQDYQAAHGTEALLNLWVPKLTQGLSASAFHAVIRLGYALSDQDTPEIVNALAFWASAYQSLGALDGYRAEHPKGEAKVSDVLEAVAADPDLGHQHVSGQGIANRLGRVARLPGYERLVEMINQSGKFSIQDLRDQSLNIFLHQPSFTTLHLVTGVEALARVADKVAAPQSLLQHYALAMANVYISRGTPDLDQSESIQTFIKDNPVPDWPFLRSQAIESGDEHKIKMVQTCQAEFHKTGDYRYPLAAGVWLTGKQPWQEV